MLNETTLSETGRGSAQKNERRRVCKREIITMHRCVYV